ncbi:hypothetical protein BCR44DRAFT_133530 [Catenaria anguillulae PL171]|uniref:Peptidase M20 dimerisation domain-containing protein n=1 Tax=Catenaria anguillulae PL171 TaxID=765915 RepID=A0A1Y2HXW7_9FUNG|nr:hypothetical protein BCR44DRAFT_133530 [Catenaria anguillulae PL171]
MDHIKHLLSTCFGPLLDHKNPLAGGDTLPTLPGSTRSTVDSTIARLDGELRRISLDLHANPELGFQEHHAVQVLTAFLEVQGFTVTRAAFGIETAFTATFEHKGQAGTEPIKVGFCSEYDALPGLGHACGHNLIAIAGLAAAVAAKETIVKHNLAAQITLYGTPAEEGGGGKVHMIDAGAFVDLDICLMLHPDSGNNSRPRCLAMQWIQVTYTGKSAHAAASPWDGHNALDAVCLAFSNLSHMRQQLQPTDRVHGIITNGGAKSNIIPAFTAANFIARAPTQKRLTVVVDKLVACLAAAAQATSTQVDIEYTMAYANQLSNDTLATLYQVEMEKRGVKFPPLEEMLAESTGSTDFGNVSHVVPGLQPMFDVEVPGAELHTKPFADKAAPAIEAHKATLRAAAGLACTALTVVANPELAKRIRQEFEQDPDRLTLLAALERGEPGSLGIPKLGPVSVASAKTKAATERTPLLLASGSTLAPPPYTP